MSTYRILAEDGSTANTIVADDGTMATLYPKGNYTLVADPQPAKVFAPLDIYNALTPQERIAIRALAASPDPLANDFIHTLDNYIASGTQVSADNATLNAGLKYLSQNPQNTPCLAAGRAQQITGG